MLSLSNIKNKYRPTVEESVKDYHTAERRERVKKRLTETESIILDSLRLGAENSTTTKHLLSVLGWTNSPNNVRRLREIIQTLRLRHKVPILAIRKGHNSGYFIAETVEELLEHLAPLKAQMNQERRLIKVLSGANIERWKNKNRGV